MARINEDGNLVGRLAALAVIAASGWWGVRFFCGGCCPLGADPAGCLTAPKIPR